MREHQPDVVILDLSQTGLDPYEITRSVKKDSELKSIPLILLTSLAIDGDKKNSIDAGADGIIEKPINPELFISQIESILKSYKTLLD